MMTKIRDIMARRAAGEKGFTLIELLVVVVILVVLAAIAVPIFLGQASKARNAKAASTVAAIGNVLSNARSLDATVTVGATDVETQSTESGSQNITTCSSSGCATVAYTPAFHGASTFSISLAGAPGCTYTMTQADSAPVGTGGC